MVSSIRSIGIGTVLFLLLSLFQAAPVAADANTCLYTPTPSTPLLALAGAMPGPWTGAVGAPTMACAVGTYTSSAANCAGTPSVGVAGAWCDIVWLGPPAPFPPPRTCTVAPPPGVTLTSIAGGWDVDGPAIPPPPGTPAVAPGMPIGPATGSGDGRIDAYDWAATGGPPGGVSFSTGPFGAGGSLTIQVYPPMGLPPPAAGGYYQLIVYAGATGPGLVPLAVSCA